MNDFTKNMAQALFNQDKINDLLRKELQQAVNDLLKAELTAFLGYDPYARAGWNTGNSRNGAYFRKVDTQFGEIEIQVPRDRNGMFHQHTLPDYKQHSDVLESMIIKLYSKGVTTREIADLIEKMYGSHYSPAQVSNISKQIFQKLRPIISANSVTSSSAFIWTLPTFLCAEKLLNVKLSILPLVSNLMATRKLSTTALRPMKTLKSGRSCSKA